MTDGSRSSPAAIALYSRPSARPREISSRSDNINIFRTVGILSRRSPHDQVLRLPDPKELSQVLDVYVALEGAATPPVSGATGRPCPVDQRREVGIAAASVDQAGSHNDATPVSVGKDGLLGLDTRG